MSKSWPYFRRKKCHFSDPKIHTSFQTWPLTNYLDKSSDKNDFLKSISNSYISLSFLLIWNWNDKLDHSVLLFPRKACPIPDQSGDQNSAKTIPFGAAHTYMAYVSEYPPSRILEKFVTLSLLLVRYPWLTFCCTATWEISAIWLA